MEDFIVNPRGGGVNSFLAYRGTDLDILEKLGLGLMWSALDS